MSETTVPQAVRLVRTLAAPPEQVFAAWTDPAFMARWLSPVGVAEAEVDARIGGRLRVTMIGKGRRIEHRGEYIAVEPPTRLVFTWMSPYTGPEPSRVTVELRAAGGGTELSLLHERLSPDAAASHAGGWTRMLDRLAAELQAAGEDR